MKKLLLTIITLSVITLNGCYDPDTATVRINLGNIPIAKHEPKSFIDRILGFFEKDAYAQTAINFVETVHIAAYSKNTVVATASIQSVDIQIVSPGVSADYNYVELNVPAGEDITILVTGEDGGTFENHNNESYRNVTYYGYKTVNLKAGYTSTVDIAMISTNDLFASLNINHDCSYITWDSAGIPLKYVIEDGAGNILYSDYSSKPVAVMMATYYFYIEFDAFNNRTSDYNVYSSCK